MLISQYSNFNKNIVVKLIFFFIRISHGTTPLKKIPSVTQTSLLVGKGSMFGPLSRTPSQHPVHGPFDLVGYSC
jgi:hypothetical protein